MRGGELWVEAYQGEVIGETLFGRLAEREDDAGKRGKLERLTLLERATKELAEPVIERRGLDPDVAEAQTSGAEMADSVATMKWADFLGSFEPVTSRFLALYRQLVELATDETEREVAEAYVAHEQALMAFVRRERGEEAGEPLAAIDALPHVKAAIDV